MKLASTPLKRLGPLPVARFMREFWQRRPCLLRAAFAPGFAAIDAQTLMRLAGRDDVESRLVSCLRGRWRLRHGPLPRSALPTQQRHWTLLVQGVDLVDPGIHHLLQGFRFISDARLDDVMASYAVDGGGVGPHVDSYDVFLLQAKGRRRWRISRQRDVTELDGAPLRQLVDFRPTREWTLEPGDMLYLPPGVAHEGTAVGECITLSIGFRTPSWAQLAEVWFDRVADRLPAMAAYRDAGTAPTRAPARLPRAMIDGALVALSRTVPGRQDAEHALLAHLTEPKSIVAFDRPPRPLSPAALGARLRAEGIELDACTRMLYSGALVAINGEVAPIRGAAASALRRLADHRRLDGAARIGAESLERLHAWYRYGWLRPALPHR